MVDLQGMLETDDGLRPVEILDRRIGAIAIAFDYLVGGLQQTRSHRGREPDGRRIVAEECVLLLDSPQQVPIGMDGRQARMRIVLAVKQRSALARVAVIISSGN